MTSAEIQQLGPYLANVIDLTKVTHKTSYAWSAFQDKNGSIAWPNPMNFIVVLDLAQDEVILVATRTSDPNAVKISNFMLMNATVGVDLFMAPSTRNVGVGPVVANPAAQPIRPKVKFIADNWSEFFNHLPARVPKNCSFLPALSSMGVRYTITAESTKKHLSSAIFREYAECQALRFLVNNDKKTHVIANYYGSSRTCRYELHTESPNINAFLTSENKALSFTHSLYIKNVAPANVIISDDSSIPSRRRTPIDEKPGTYTGALVVDVYEDGIKPFDIDSIRYLLTLVPNVVVVCRMFFGQMGTDPLVAEGVPLEGLWRRNTDGKILFYPSAQEPAYAPHTDNNWLWTRGFSDVSISDIGSVGPYFIFNCALTTSTVVTVATPNPVGTFDIITIDRIPSWANFLPGFAVNAFNLVKSGSVIVHVPTVVVLNSTYSTRIHTGYNFDSCTSSVLSILNKDPVWRTLSLQFPYFTNDILGNTRDACFYWKRQAAAANWVNLRSGLSAVETGLRSARADTYVEQPTTIKDFILPAFLLYVVIKTFIGAHKILNQTMAIKRHLVRALSQLLPGAWVPQYPILSAFLEELVHERFPALGFFADVFELNRDKRTWMAFLNYYLKFLLRNSNVGLADRLLLHALWNMMATYSHTSGVWFPQKPQTSVVLEEIIRTHSSLHSHSVSTAMDLIELGRDKFSRPALVTFGMKQCLGYVERHIYNSSSRSGYAIAAVYFIKTLFHLAWNKRSINPPPSYDLFNIFKEHHDRGEVFQFSRAASCAIPDETVLLPTNNSEIVVPSHTRGSISITSPYGETIPDLPTLFRLLPVKETRNFIFPFAVNNSLPFQPANSSGMLLCAIQSRLFRDPYEGSVPPADQFWKSLTSYMWDIPKLQSIPSIEQALQAMQPSKARVARQALQNLNLQTPTSKQKVFLKWNETIASVSPGNLKPRSIIDLPKHVHALMTPYIMAVENWCKENWDGSQIHTVNSRLISFSYASGIDQIALNRLSAKLQHSGPQTLIVAAGDDVAISWGKNRSWPFGDSDYSMFDHTIGKGALSFVATLMSLFGIPAEIIDLMLEACKGQFTINVEGYQIRGDPGIQQKTGIRTTSWANTCITLFAHASLMLAPIDCDVKKHMYQYGLIAKYSDRQSFEDLIFLKSWWVGSTILPLPSAICKAGKVMSSPQLATMIRRPGFPTVKFTYRESLQILAYNTALSFGHVPKDYPILGAYFRMLHRCGRPQVIANLDIEIKQYRVLEVAADYNRELALNMTCRRYGLTSSDIRSVEELYDRTTELPMFYCSPVFDLLFKVDYA